MSKAEVFIKAQLKPDKMTCRILPNVRQIVKYLMGLGAQTKYSPHQHMFNGTVPEGSIVYIISHHNNKVGPDMQKFILSKRDVDIILQLLSSKNGPSYNYNSFVT